MHAESQAAVRGEQQTRCGESRSKSRKKHLATSQPQVLNPFGGGGQLQLICASLFGRTALIELFGHKLLVGRKCSSRQEYAQASNVRRRALQGMETNILGLYGYNTNSLGLSRFRKDCEQEENTTRVRASPCARHTWPWYSIDAPPYLDIVSRHHWCLPHLPDSVHTIGGAANRMADTPTCLSSRGRERE